MSLGASALRLVEPGKGSSEREEVSLATLRVATTNGTVTLLQSVEYLPTRYLPELGGEGGTSFRCSKQSGCAIGQQTTKTTQSFHEELPAKPWVALKSVRRATADQHCFDFNHS